jgi:ADP-ribosylation factor-like protein 1
MQGAALCVFANKKDLPGAKTAAEITELLGLTSMKVRIVSGWVLRRRVVGPRAPPAPPPRKVTGDQDRQWTIQATSAVKGEGLNEGMDWLANVLAAQQ